VFEVPLASDAGSDDERVGVPDPPAEPWTEGDEFRSGAGILLVDDHRESLAALNAVLEPLSERLVSAESGEEALRALLREEFAVILLDVRMADLDGFETARIIRSRPGTRHIPIIFLTAQASDVEEIALAYATGAVDYVIKPFEPEILRAKVAVFVELYRERGERVRQSHARAKAEAVARTVRTLQILSDAAMSHLELDGLVSELVDRATTLLEADGAALLLRDELGEGVQVGASRGLPLPLIDGRSVLFGQGTLGRLAAERQPALLRGPELTVDEPGGGGVSSLLVVPLSVGEELVGLLLLGCVDERRFDNGDLELLTLAADRMATAIDHVQRFADSRQLVETLQRSLLPEQLPRHPSIELAARYLPSGVTPQIGGDWYDAVALDHDRTAVMIGDVVGHGVRAATTMSELRGALRAFAIEGHGPSAALQQLDRVVHATMGHGMVATALFLVIDAERGLVTLARAGHPPPALRAADGSVRFLETETTLPVGIDHRARPAEAQYPIAPGETLLLFTDGLVESRREPIDVSFERLLGAFADAPDDVDQICEHVLNHTLPDGGRRDDVALLVVRLLGRPEGTLNLTLPATAESVTLARHRLRSWLADNAPELDPIACSDLEVAWSEACTNVVRHAYGPGEASYEATATREPGAVVLIVRDTGNWRSGPSQPGGGRGLPLMRQLCDELVVDRTSDGTLVQMRRVLAGVGADPGAVAEPVD
jgi:serine phosphatase RsbU (regulator of sigma subunit)/CheY-like chemotaxis protein/anti-sigma regulatory factor (Ser/Thr protein kinase)